MPRRALPEWQPAHLAAKTARGDCRLFVGDANGALTVWNELRAQGALDPQALAHVAYAAQLTGQTALSDELRVQEVTWHVDRTMTSRWCRCDSATSTST